MTYDFSNLSYADFEDFVRDLLGAELKIRFEAFGPGPDGGIDGRHAKGRKTTILQAKHYGGSTFPQLLATMRREYSSIERLSPARYILATSRHLSATNKAKLARVIGRFLRAQEDIYSRSDLNSLLRKHSAVEKTHIKLWLSSAAVLERITHAAAYTYAAITLDEIAAKVRVYAPNPSFGVARNTLESEHILIVSGPPGVGKTTLAEMLSYAYVGEGWRLVPIRSLDDGFAAIIDMERQIFLFDDFLGRIALDKNALAAKDSDLARFIRRIRGSTNARFILTTRAYIFEEARRLSEHLSDSRLDISKYVLDVGVYTRRIRARILYNHLLVAGTPATHIRTLIESGKIGEIVDHVNYNPRVIEWMTDRANVTTIPALEYADSFVAALANPKRLWDTAFRTHISERCRHLLYVLFFASEFGADVVDLRLTYQTVHSHLCTKYGQPYDPIDFEEALRILEGSFITIRGTSVGFVNPSLRDYLAEYLSDLGQLKDLAYSSRQAEWAREVWRHGRRIASSAELGDYTRSFARIAKEFLRIPTWRKSAANPHAVTPYDLANSDRIKLLLDWFEASGDNEFGQLAVDLARKPVSGFTSWRDGIELIELIVGFRDDYDQAPPFGAELVDALKEGLVRMLEGGVDSDDLERMSDAIEERRDVLGADVVAAATVAIQREFDEIDRMITESDSESTLEEHRTTLRKLAPRANIETVTLRRALKAIDERIATLSDESEEAESPSFTGKTNEEADKFDDVALRNLFAPLLER